MSAEILAKSDGKTLFDHVRECISVARTIISLLPLNEEEKSNLMNDVILGLAFHDVGKAATGFQNVMRGTQESWHHRRHEILSASLASSKPDVGEAIIFAVLTHHKSIPNSFSVEERKALDYDSIPLDEGSEQYLTWKKMKAEWFENYGNFRATWKKICELINRPDLLMLGSLPTIRIDRSWLRRGVGGNSQLKKQSFSDRRYFSLVRGLLMASDHMASGGNFPISKSWSISESVNRGLSHDIRMNVHGFQKIASEIRGNLILRAPTGSGKTEAALMWAAGNEQMNSRLFYVLPNIASINAMYQRLGGFFGSESVGLLHSRAREKLYRELAADDDLESKLDSERTASILASVAHSIWFPVRVSTPHQILRFSLRGRGWETMLAEFPKALFIFDEIHAYNPRLVGQIIATAKLANRWNAKCVFLSATMPSFLIDLISKNLEKDGMFEPRIVFPDPVRDKTIMDLKRHVLLIDEGTLLDQIQNIVEQMERGKNILVVCNTVSASQEVFLRIRDSLKEKFGKVEDSTVKLIHSRFSRRDRTSKENSIMDKDTRPKILVSTQVVEVSLDISYDIAYLEPAPIDAIIQRMGRVNRKGEQEPAEIHIMRLEISEHSVYDRRDIVRESLAELSALSDLHKPLGEIDLVNAAERVYAGGYRGDDLDKFLLGLNNRELKDFENEMLAGASEDWKEQIFDDSWGIDVLPSRFRELYEDYRKDKLVIESLSLLVPVPVKSKIAEEADRSYDPPISSWNYSTELGFSVPKDDPWDDDLLERAPNEPSNII